MARSLDPASRKAWRGFQELPNIGPAGALDLVRLGLRSHDEVAASDPDALYARLGELDGMPHDPCVLDTLRAVVSNLRTGREDPWWAFTPLRKQSAVQGTPP